MEDPQGGVGRLEGAHDREDTLVWRDACFRGAVPRIRQAQDAFEPVVVRNQIWFRLGSMVAPVLFSFGSRFGFSLGSSQVPSHLNRF